MSVAARARMYSLQVFLAGDGIVGLPAILHMGSKWCFAGEVAAERHFRRYRLNAVVAQPKIGTLRTKKTYIDLPGRASYLVIQPLIS
jgi:hypothetical protein